MVDTSLVFDLIARDKASATFDKVGRSADQTHSKFIGMAVKGAAAMGVLTAATGVFLFKAGAPYVASLNQIQALTGANKKQMDSAAKTLESNAGLYAKMGQTTGDAASGVVELTKAGMSLHGALKAVYGTMTLAKAGALSVADASGITANALNTFHLKASQAGDVANYLANAANISSADVSDLAESLKYVAPVAAAAGVSIKETNAVLAELANAGIKGSSAGTALRTFLLSLQAPSSQASGILKDLGVNVYDATGKMKPLGDVIGIVKDKLSGLNQEQKNADLKAIFGKVGIAGATTILDEGAKGLKKYTDGVGKAGAATKLAESRSKGLSGSLDIIKSSAISAVQTLYRKLSPIADNLIRPLANKFATFSSNIGPDITKGLNKVGNVFKKLDISGLGRKLKNQAKAWAAPVIAGFNAGLNTGDWSGLGKALGNGIIKAAGAMGDLTAKFGKILSKIDWVGIGIAMGKQAPSLFLGLAAGILNFDMGGMLKGVAKHWQDVLIGLIMLALTPMKIIGPIAKGLERIPFAGKLLSWGLLAMKKFSDRMAGVVFDSVKFLGRGFLTGFRRVFPEVGAKFADALRILPTKLGVMAINVADKALKMVRGIGSSIARGIGGVAAKIGELIGHMVRPFADAGSWLVSKGVSFISGLIRGLTSKFGDLLSPLRGLGGRMVGAVGNMATRLYDAGAQLIQGLINGITSRIGAVKSTLGNLTSKLTSWKGPPEKDRVLLKPAGIMLMEGLVAGIKAGSPLVKKALGDITSYIQSQGSRLRSLMSAKSGFAQGFQGFTSSVFSTDLSHSSTDADGNTVTTPASVQDMIAYQRQQANKARQLKADVHRLHRMGLSDSLIKQLQASGESGMAQIHTLAGGTQADINQMNALNKQTTSALGAAGQIAGSQIYDAQIENTKAQLDTAKQLKRLIEALIKGDKGEIHIHLEGHTLVESIRKHQKNKGVKPTV